MKRTLVNISALSGILMILTACVGEPLHSIPTESVKVNSSTQFNQTKDWNIKLSTSTASLNLGTGGADASGPLIGQIDYNLSELKPNLNLSNGRYEVSQDSLMGQVPEGTQTNWNLKLGQTYLFDLNVENGAGKGRAELGGVAIRNLNWSQQAGDSEINFQQPNMRSLDKITIRGGASTQTWRGLANANFRQAELSAKGGSYNLYFDGKLNEAEEIKISVDATSIHLFAATNSVRVITESKVTNSVAQGDWTKAGKEFRSPNWNNGNNPAVTIYLDANASSLVLK